MYQRCLPAGVVELLQRQAGIRLRRSIYTAQVVIWLMILQRLQPGGTLATSVEALLAGGPIGEEGEQRVRWTPSRFGGRRQGGMPEGACVESRLIAVRIGRGKSKKWLYLFTTLNLSQEEVITLYSQRWKIETGLRSLKRTVRLQHVAARNESMLERELLTAVAAYNLVRAVMALAARRHNISPRHLSFTFVLNAVNANWRRLQSQADPASYQREVLGLLDAAAQGTHPKRKKRRSYPRAVRHRSHGFPARGKSFKDTI